MEAFSEGWRYETLLFKVVISTSALSRRFSDKGSSFFELIILSGHILNGNYKFDCQLAE